MASPAERLLAAAHEASRYVRLAGLAGVQAFRRGQPYERCPYYFETAEARKWKRAWLAEKDKSQ